VQKDGSAGREQLDRPQQAAVTKETVNDDDVELILRSEEQIATLRGNGFFGRGSLHERAVLNWAVQAANAGPRAQLRSQPLVFADVVFNPVKGGTERQLLGEQQRGIARAPDQQPAVGGEPGQDEFAMTLANGGNVCDVHKG